jgi:2-desacetyl-2-hydroxyethyl bacteriochlorophyllide A dehydrogenase
MEVPGQAELAAFPHVPGYQAAGIVREVGAEAAGIEPGDRVFSRNCRRPATWQGSWWGGHIGSHVARAENVIKVPGGLSMRAASSLLLAQVGYNGATKPRVRPGDSAVVIGAGLVGQYAGQVLRHRGAHVLMCDVSEYRLRVASMYSADEVFDNSGDDLADHVRDRHPDGVDIVLETASSSQTVRLGIDLLKRGGQLVLNGYYPPGESTLDWHWLRTKEITTYCPNSRTRERLEATLRLIDGGQMKVDDLVTHEFAQCEAAQAYGLLLGPSKEFLGIVLDWRNET